MTGQILHLARRAGLPCATAALLAATLGIEPLQARPTLQFVDVTSGGRNAYRVTGVTTVSNYRIGVAGPVDLLPLSTQPLRRKASTRYAAVKAPRMVGAGVDEVLPGYLQCVPYARQASGIQLYGDARTWWGQAAGRYGRGNTPRVGAVMAFRPYGKMVLGHVAMVSRVIDSRRVLLRHANWSPINGKRGQVERDVMAVDVSPAGDWSAVRVWFDPIQRLGSTHWPVSGFIYPRGAVVPVHGLAASRWTSDPIGAIIAAFSKR